MTSHQQDDVIWLTGVQIKILHAETINLFGVLQESEIWELQSALARPQNLRAYDDSATVLIWRPRTVGYAPENLYQFNR